MNYHKNSFNDFIYYIYFKLIILFFSGKKKYVLVDIDNTICDQVPRLKKHTVNGHCNFKKANSTREIINDQLFDHTKEYIHKIENQNLVWFTSRSIKQCVGTLIWLKKLQLPFKKIVFTGSMSRKIMFLEIFLKKHNVSFLVDDMCENYESGKPLLVDNYRRFLEKHKITFYLKIPRK